MELEKSLRPSALPNVGWGVAVGSKKCSAPVFHCSVGWLTGDLRGGRDLATEGSPLVESSEATLNTMTSFLQNLSISPDLQLAKV
jgi:hypothetical protein